MKMTTDGDGSQPIATGHLTDTGDLNRGVYKGYEGLIKPAGLRKRHIELEISSGRFEPLVGKVNCTWTLVQGMSEQG